MTSVPLPLTRLAAGQAGVVTDIALPAEVRARLLEMGLTPGTAIHLVRYAPLGDPVEIKVRGSNLSLRRHEAEQIHVRPAD
jgi:ferrous iron transport protein A